MPPKRQGDDVEIRVIASSEPKPYFDPWYLASIPGGLKCVVVICGFVSFVCLVMINAEFFGVYIAAATSIFGFLMSLVLLIMYCFNLIQLVGLDIPKYETYYCAIWAALYLISFGVLLYSAIRWPAYSTPWGASAFFAFICLVTYSIDFVVRFRASRAARQQPGPVVTGAGGYVGAVHTYATPTTAPQHGMQMQQPAQHYHQANQQTRFQ